MSGDASSPELRYRPIGDYGFLSDCHSTALVSSEGSIDWACLRRFDSGSSFGRLLDVERGGFFSIRPADTITSTERRYRGDTMLLETTMRTDRGAVRVVDCFAMREGGSAEPLGQLLRLVEGVEGAVDVAITIEPRFDYGTTQPWLRNHADRVWSAVGGDDAIVIASECDLDLRRDDCCLSGVVTVEAGRSIAITVVSQPAHLLDPDAADVGAVRERLAVTEQWWRDWSSSTDARGRFEPVIRRSALVLKGLCCAPTGAIIAAPTTSLPEVPGGTSNWDYRYSWVRDATLTLEALQEVGHSEVARGFRDFVIRSSAGHGDELQIMYGAYGERRLTEVELDLEGWRGARPVRVGNGAATQTQLDVYGHLLDAAHVWHRGGGDLDDDEWSFLRTVVDAAVRHRNDPDSGIWELRGDPQHFVHSKVMVWVALDRGIRLVDEHGFDGEGMEHDVATWRRCRDELRDEIEREGVDADRGIFVQSYGSSAVDASLLKLALVGFVEATDDRMVATTEAIIDELSTGPDGLIRRFRRPDAASSDDGGHEGVFLLCSCWLVEVLALQGRIDEAARLFEAIVSVGNDLGLYAEEYSVDGDEMLGNFPQAFTHLGLIAAEARLRSVTGPS